MATTSKKDLINRIAERTGTKKVLAKTVVQQLFNEIVGELTKSIRLAFRDLGVFETKIRPARIAQNPKTLESVHVPAKRRVVFKAGKLMKEEVNASQNVTCSVSTRTEVTPASTSGSNLRGDVG